MFGHSFLFIRFSGIIALLAAVTLQALADGDTPRYTPTFRQGVDALAKGKSDSAILYFVKSYSEGLPQDSLFYFWAEALLRKGVLDSALAANYMVSSTTAGGLRIPTLVQRSTIYRRLGWSRDEERILDTIHASHEYRRALLMPEIDMGIAAGYGAIKHATDTSKPWGAGLGGSFFTKEQGPFGRADLRASWRLTKGQRYLSAGLAGVIMQRQYNSDGSIHAADSADITGSVFASAAGKYFSSTYTLSLNRRIDDSLFIGAGIEGGIAGSGKLMPLLWGGGAVSLTTKGTISNSRAWLFASAQQTLGKRMQAGYTLFVNSYFEQPSAFGFNYTTTKILYVEDGSSQYPVFYTDNSYSAVIDTSVIRVITGALRDDIIASGTVLHVGLKQPFSGIQINPRVSLTLKSKSPVQFGCSWKWHYFPERYEWDQILAYAPYILYSRADNASYFVPDDLLGLMIRYADGGLLLSPAAQAGSPVIHHTLRRIDNTLSGDMALQLYDGRFGTGVLRFYGSKTWSTLSGKAPVEIPEWSISTSIEWRVKIANTLIQH